VSLPVQGKIVDAWFHGLPVATTIVGAEGMNPQDYRHPAEVRFSPPVMWTNHIGSFAA
jgi:hypothetical protein